MSRFFTLISFVVSFLFSGCIAQPYIYDNNPSSGYNRGYALGAGLFTGRQPAVMPDAWVARVSPEIASYADRAATEPGWYTCNGWVYDPNGNAMYFAAQSAKEYHGQYRLSDTPPRPQKYGTDGYGRTTHPDPCYHVRTNQ